MFARIKYQKFIKCFMEEFPDKTIDEAKTEWIKFRSAESLTMTDYGYGNNNLEKQKKFYDNFYNKYHWFYKNKDLKVGENK